MFNTLDLLGRLLLAALFANDVWSILGNYSGTAGFMEQHGVPGILLPLAILVQAVGSILIVLGWYTRIGALALAGFCTMTAVLFHYPLSDSAEAIQFWKDLALAGGLLVLTAHGAGHFSVDARARTES